MHSDVLVVGAGIVGAACARALAGAGLAVTLLEKGGTASGTSASGEGNVLVSDKGPGPELDLAIHAARLWRETAPLLEDELGPAFPSIEYEPKGGIVVATSDDGALALVTFAAQQARHGVQTQPLTADQALALEPDLDPSLTAAVHYPQDAQVQPVVATEALLASARRAGAVVRAGEAVTGAVSDRTGRLVGVRTTRGEHHAGAVVLAAGPWSGEVGALLGVSVPIRPRRGVLLVTTPMPRRIRHKVYDGDYVGATQSSDAALQTSTVVESTASGTVLIGSSREQTGFDGRLRVEVMVELARKALTLFPFLARVPVMRSYGGFRPYAADHLPLIGPDERLPGLWHASGHEGAGIGLALATAELLAAGIAGAPTMIDGAAFLPSRPGLAAHLAGAAV